MDAQPTLVDAIRRAALVQSLVEYLRVEPGPLSPQPGWLEHENRHRASHHGLEARYILDLEGDTLPMREITMRVLDSVAPKARELGILQYLEDLRESF